MVLLLFCATPTSVCDVLHWYFTLVVLLLLHVGGNALC
jgi:hypothetical protein